MKINKILKSTIIATSILMSGIVQAEPMRIGLVVKALGIGFFEAANDGAQEAAKELQHPQKEDPKMDPR